MKEISQMAFRRMVENQTIAIVILNHELVIEYMNPAAEILFQISLKKAAGRQWQAVFPESGGLEDRMQETIASGHPFTEREYQLVIPGRTILTLDCTTTVLDLPDSGPAVQLELVHLDRQLRIAREENLMAQQSATIEIVRGLAHEIKNPLGGLRGAAQLLQKELPDPQLEEYTQVIIDEADRMQNLLNRMLGSNKLPQRREMNIHEVVERVFTLVSSEVGDRLTIERDYDPSLPELYADPEQLIQAILNLVRNAVQALADGGTITLRTRAERQMTIGHHRHRLSLVIEVIDDGPGIPKEMMEKIFYPMVTGRVQGTGLGLSIAQTLVNQHGGLIECESEPGRTVFRVMIPLEKENAIHE